MKKLIALLLCIPCALHAAGYQVSAWSLGDAASLTAATDRGALDEMSVDWYASQTNLRIGASGEDLELIAAARAKSVRILATVADVSKKGAFSASISTRILSSPKNIAKHVQALVDLCEQKGYDGIDLDWEAVKPKNKAKFTSFVLALSAALHAKSKILSMAIAPKVTEPGDWSAPQSEDYAALGAVVDEFKVMTYDYSGSWSLPGPISPLDWIDAVLTHTETLVPPEKIMMGVPFYGYDWLGKRTANVAWSDAQNLVAAHQATVTHDASGEATFTYNDKSGHAHTVFFQDRSALAAKLQALHDNHPGIRGIAIWVMGGEDPAFWDEIELQLH